MSAQLQQWREAWFWTLAMRRTIKHRVQRLLTSDRPPIVAPPRCWQRATGIVLATMLLAIGTLRIQAAAELRSGAEEQASQGGTAANENANQRNDGPAAAEPVGQPAANSRRERPPQVEVIEGRSTGFELHRVTITGTARNQRGEPVAGAEIFVAADVGYRLKDVPQIRGRTKTVADGSFVLQDVQLLVIRPRANPVPKPVEGGFVVFGTADGHGFTWHPSRVYRPYERPEGVDAGDPDQEATDRAFYEGDAIAVDLAFEPPATLRGRITEDTGRPLAGVKVQLGVVDSVRHPNGYGVRSCSYIGPPGDSDAEPISFNAIDSLPASFRETRTDENGNYELLRLRRDTRYLALIDPGAAFDVDTFRLETSHRDPTQQQRVHCTGYDGELDWEFAAPRDVTIHVRYEDDDRPARDVTVTAHHARNFRRAGGRARTDAEGTAGLQLPPGNYTLHVEPPADVPYLFLQREIAVPAAAAEHKIDLTLQPAAVVELHVRDARTGQPLSDIRFAYETESSSEQTPLSSQTVYADYAATDEQGVLRAFVEPGRKRFVVLPHAQEPVPDGGRGEVVDLAAGQTTEVHLAVSGTSHQRPSRPNEESTYPPEILAAWSRQADLMQRAKIRITMRWTNGHRAQVGAEVLEDLFGSLDPRELPDVPQLLRERLGQEVRLASSTLAFGGERHRFESYKLIEDQQEASASRSARGALTLLQAFNGHEAVHFDPTNAQVNVYRRGNNRGVLIRSLDRIYPWPLLAESQYSISNSPVLEQRDGMLSSEIASDGYTLRQLIDDETGFVYRMATDREQSDSGSMRWYFAPRELPGGMILPQTKVEYHYRDGRVNRLEVMQIDETEVVARFPPDAFSVSIPMGAHIVDYRHSPKDGPRRRESIVVRAPVTDVAAYLHRREPGRRAIEETLKYGEPAPAIEPAHWLNHDGETAPPNTKGKVVLVDFWGVTCGPCVSQLPEIRTAARHFAGKDLVLVGLHDSHTTVDELAQFAREKGLEYALAIDRPAIEAGWFGETMRSFGVRGIPSYAVIDREGRLVYLGHIQEALRSADRLLDE